MSKENEKTVEVYKKTANLYLINSNEHDRLDPVKAKKKSEKLQNLIKTHLSFLPKQSKVFEIGCGDGTNSKFMQSLGFNVTASDVADDFLNSATSKGLNTLKFDALNDKINDKYSAVFCWRVLVHFTKEDVEKLLNKVYNCLEDNGVFIFNVINRDNKTVDNEWVDFGGEYHMGVDRFYSYFTQSDIDSLVSKTNFKINYFSKQGGSTGDKWLIYVLKK